ncbi:hypothetical protein O0L34_g17428 [Tuta absoluta]|nr:hypothetical protein O0L34_g17428 [Tuta absoluta]
MLKIFLFTVLLSVVRTEKDLQKITTGQWKLTAIFSAKPIGEKEFKKDCNPMTIVKTNLTCQCGDETVSIVSVVQNETLMDSHPVVVVDTKEGVDKFQLSEETNEQANCNCGEFGRKTVGVLFTISDNYVLMFNWPAITTQVLIAREPPSLSELGDFIKTVDVLENKHSFAGCLKEYENED